MKRVIKFVALAIAGACIPLYAYISGVNDATDDNVETVTYTEGKPDNEDSDEEEVLGV